MNELLLTYRLMLNADFIQFSTKPGGDCYFSRPVRIRLPDDAVAKIPCPSRLMSAKRETVTYARAPFDQDSPGQLKRSMRSRSKFFDLGPSRMLGNRITFKSR